MRGRAILLSVLSAFAMVLVSCAESTPPVIPPGPTLPTEALPVSIEMPNPTNLNLIGQWQNIGPIIEGETLYARNLVATEEDGKTILYVGTGDPGRILKWSEETLSWSDISYKLTKLVEDKLTKEAEGFRKANPPLPIPGYRYSIGWIGALAVDPTNSKTIYAGLGAPMRLAKSADGGESWSLIDYRHSEPRSLAISNQNPKVVYLGTNGGLSKSVDGGETWKLLDNGIPTSNFLVWAVAIDPNNDSFVMAGGEPADKMVEWGKGTFFYSDDSGNSWQEVDVSDILDVIVLELEFDSRTKIVYMTTEAPLIAYSNNGGKDWERSDLPSRTSCLTINPLNSVIYVGTLTYSGGPGGVFQSEDGSQNWQEINEGLKPREVADFTISKDGSFLYAALIWSPYPDFKPAGVWRLRLN